MGHTIERYIMNMLRWTLLQMHILSCSAGCMLSVAGDAVRVLRMFLKLVDLAADLNCLQSALTTSEHAVRTYKRSFIQDQESA